MNVIAISNQKGGVGKTTTTVNLGVALARKSNRVLLIDFDPQGNLSQSFGWTTEKFTQDICTVYGAMSGEYKLTPMAIFDGLDLCVSNVELAGVEMELAQEPGREFILSGLLKQVKDQYDFVLIDCPPSLNLLTLNALTAANSVLIPVSAEYLPMQGLQQLMGIIEKVKVRLNPNLKVSGIALTKATTTNLAREAKTIIKKAFPTLLLETVCRNFISLAEAPAFGKSIFDYAPKSQGASDYDSLCNELIPRMKAVTQPGVLNGQ